MTILGISAFYHDSAAAIVEDGHIIAAAQEERFTRKKHDPAFPANAIKYCLKYAGTTLDQLDAVVFYDKPLLKFERLLDTYYGFSPKGLPSFVTAIPVWLREKMFLKRVIRQELSAIEDYDKRQLKLLFPEHHLSHAASTYYASSFEEAAVLTIDGVGEWATAGIYKGNGKQLEVLQELQFPHSVGLLYSAFTYFLGFKVNSGEYKLMGLAPYGSPNAPQVQEFIQIIKSTLVDLKEDGSIWLNQDYFNYATGLRMVHDDKWEQLFGFPRRPTEADLEQHHCNLAMAIQIVTEEVVIKMATEAKRLTGSKNLCIAGGVALNCVANGKLLAQNIFEHIFIQPAAGDCGGALGAALAAYYLYFDQERIIDSAKMDGVQGAYLGPEFSDLDIELDVKRFDAKYRKINEFKTLADSVAELIAAGNVVGWFQGRMEFGPRALGNRSILGDARNAEMQKKLNLKIKYREGFRPFAPSVLAEDASHFFDLKAPSPYMLLVAPIAEERRATIPDNYFDLPLMERLYIQRSDVQAITHVDFSARVQTVYESTNPAYYELLKSIKAATGYGILVNTSFNVRGEPIVCTPEDAYRCFMRTEMDYLVVGNYLFKKSDQPEWDKKDKWQEEFVLD